MVLGSPNQSVQLYLPEQYRAYDPDRNAAESMLPDWDRQCEKRKTIAKSAIKYFNVDVFHNTFCKEHQ